MVQPVVPFIIPTGVFRMGQEIHSYHRACGSGRAIFFFIRIGFDKRPYRIPKYMRKDVVVEVIKPRYKMVLL